jgi:hypothetical protein
MNNKHTLQEFLDIVAQKNMFQTKYLNNSLSDITVDEVAQFENLLNFYMLRNNSAIEQIVDHYLDLIFCLVEEQRYFVEYGKYRFSTFAEVENYYKDSIYMNSYSVGLGLSTYLWRLHRELKRLFDKYLNISNMTGGGVFGNRSRSRRIFCNGNAANKFSTIYSN